MTVPLRVLMVEDSEDDAELIRLELRRAGFDVTWKRVETEPDFIAALDEPWDVILSDYQMPQFNGLRAFALFERRGLETPFIFFSGVLGEDRAVEAMRAGARDYLLKGNLPRLTEAVKRELNEARSRALRRGAEEDLRKLEEQLRQSQKMEAVGRLAGGVAHDFNNLLTVILSFGGFVLEELDEKSQGHEDMQEVLKAARKAAALTAQLLAFSRRNPVAPKIVNVNKLVEDMDRMLRRIVGEDVLVSTTLNPDLWNVCVDPGSLEQVVINLVVNARDAMLDGGKLTIETSNTQLDAEYPSGHITDVNAGDYVAIAVSDDGMGMDAETQLRIFEPFFTTKDATKGTGLGLSTCYGIVKQAGGYIWVYSEPGRGTTFKIYLPRVTDAADVVAPRVEPASLSGSETILVVEDDAQVRKLAVRALSGLGYRVVEAANGKEALEACAQPGENIDLLMTDVVMPEMSGQQLVEELGALLPELRVLYMSGYTAHAIVHRGVLAPDTLLLQKPFTPELLAKKVREVLDG